MSGGRYNPHITRALLALAAVLALGLLLYAALRPRPDAVDLAWAAVERAPESAAAWGALGDAQAAADQLEAAVHAYRTAARLGEDPSLEARLGFILYARGEDAEALSLLRGAAARGAKLPMLTETIRELERAAPVDAGVPDGGEVEPPAPRPELDAGPTRCRVPIAKRTPSGGLLVGVRVADRPAVLVVDTGATITVIAQRLLLEAGIPIDEERRFDALTANGKTSFASATLPEISLEDRTVAAARVAVCAECGVEAIADGLLGLDLLAAFGVRLDPAAGALELSDCRPR